MPHDGVEVMLDVGARSNGVGRGARFRVATAEDVDVGVADRGDPAATIGALAHHHLGHEQFAGGQGENGMEPTAIGPGVSPTRSSWSMEARNADNFVHRDPHDFAAPSEPNSIADEQAAAVAGNVVQVEVGVERNGDCVHSDSRRVCR